MVLKTLGFNSLEVADMKTVMRVIDVNVVHLDGNLRGASTDAIHNAFKTIPLHAPENLERYLDSLVQNGLVSKRIVVPTGSALYDLTEKGHGTFRVTGYSALVRALE